MVLLFCFLNKQWVFSDIRLLVFGVSRLRKRVRGWVLNTLHRGLCSDPDIPWPGSGWQQETRAFAPTGSLCPSGAWRGVMGWRWGRRWTAEWAPAKKVAEVSLLCKLGGLAQERNTMVGSRSRDPAHLCPFNLQPSIFSLWPWPTCYPPLEHP